ncbi:DUF3823 domain-containing protein [Cytophagaceae bacterium YF14B1]|uniref:DUF3823 domain-containing protein n=1 Tax=Xanthocytophaga flava TaxID=3048013 RepID=A0AAE3UD34_9BACT|nr:DUF3823 domain-containing protein [Xanthocytophaga flavus]MDJ1485479.1 DUF3823 domain-containing protein [Xanthocytophaga flavus]
MKQILFYLTGIMMITTVSSCAFDNYDAPDTYLTGRIVYNGEPINVAYDNVIFELWEPGWQTKIPINVPVTQDGSYSTILFKSTYKLVFQSGQGPFRMLQNDQTGSDTLIVDLKGSQTLDIEVLPYYMIRNAQFSSTGDRKVTASCRVEKIITDILYAKDVEHVSLYVSKTQFVDQRTSMVSQEITGSAITDLNNVSLSVTVPSSAPIQNYIYARIGVKISGIEDMIFSPVQKIEL